MEQRSGALTRGNAPTRHKFRDRCRRLAIQAGDVNGDGPGTSEVLWCARRDSNPHDFTHCHLKAARLPIPPRALGISFRLAPDRIDGAQPRHDHDGGEADEPGHRERVWLSARDGRGMELLQAALARRLDLQRVFGELRLPPQAGRLRAGLHQLQAVRAEQADEHGWLLQLDLPRAEAERLAARADGGR